MELADALWLIPIEDRRQLNSQREGMLSAFTSTRQAPKPSIST